MTSQDAAFPPRDQVGRSSTYVCIDYEIDGDPQGADPVNLITEVFLAGGASLIDHPLPIVASFDDAGTAMEAAVVAQWRTQREINDATRKLRVGVHLGELAEAIKSSENVNNDYKDYRAKKDSEISSIKNQLADVTSENEKMKIKINGYEREVFDRPDGQIVKVASRLKSVFINIGSEDGLPQNETFSIYDQDVINFDKGKHKAKIEVTRIYPYRAEARITEEDPTNPILSGDHVLTATWDPGNKVKFAVAGAFHLDGDIYDDRDKLIKMIERNGGEVVATHDDEGTITGKIDASVRYIVIGKPPTLAEDAGEGLMRNSSAIVAAMRTLEAEAKKNTVEPIDLPKLLNRMGVRAKPKTTIIQSGNIPLPTKSPRDSDR